MSENKLNEYNSWRVLFYESEDELSIHQNHRCHEMQEEGRSPLTLGAVPLAGGGCGHARGAPPRR